MNKVLLPIFSIFLLLIIGFVPLPQEQNKYFGSITLPLGQVFVQESTSGNWNKARFNDSIYVREKVKTLKKSRCEINFPEKQIVRIGEQAIIKIGQIDDEGNSVVIESGKIWVNKSPNANGRQFKVRTPTSVCAIRGTVYRLSCDSNFSSYRVYDGEIRVTPLDEDGNIVSDTVFTVGVGEELIMVKDFEEYKRSQERALLEFLNEQQFGFEEYIRRQKEYLQEFKRREAEAFKQFKSYHVAQEQFDREKDRESDWVKWNLKRDKMIK